MKHFILSISLIALFFCSKSQTDNKIVIGRIDSIQSSILNEKRKIWVYVPQSNFNEDYAKQRYPVVYLLDGESHFSSVVGMIQQLSAVNNNMICPEMIVVGIPNVDRTRDLTPTHAEAVPLYLLGVGGSAETSGGGEKFLSFIEKELMAYIDAQYPTAPYKVLIGHSFGGLTVMQTFVHHTNLFKSYICIDPSMWWDNQTLLKEVEKVLAEKKFQGTSLFLGIANTMGEDMNINKVLQDTTSVTTHIRSLLSLRSYLRNNKQNGLRYQAKYYSEDSHASVPLITEYDALHFLFDYYPFKITLRDLSDTTSALADKCEKHFSNVSKQMGYKVKPPEVLMNHMGYQALANKQFKKAERFFKYNIDNYPDSYNVYDSIGDYFDAIGDKSNAMRYFQKSLLLKENADIRKKLENLQSK